MVKPIQITIKFTYLNDKFQYLYQFNKSYLILFCLFIYLIIHLFFLNSLNWFLCPHLAIKSHLWFNRLPGSGYNICIFSSRHKLHLPSKQLGVIDLFNILHWISEVKPLFFNYQKCLDKAVWFFKRSWENMIIKS